MYLNVQQSIDINGVSQYISIRSEKSNGPLLLYLHGGPGDAALPLLLKYNRPLEQHFTVVIWEQRGAGKSYYPFKEADGITIDIFLADLFTLTKWLLQRFAQEKLYLVGHSWGSVLGLRFIQEHPQLIKAYIGCGQVVNMKKSCQEAYQFACTHADEKTAERLKQIDCTYTGDNWLSDLLFVTKQVVKHKGSLYGKTSYSSLILPFLCSWYYSPLDLLRRQRGALQSIRFLWQELMQVDFTGCIRYDVPVLFAEGRHDNHVSSILAHAYYETIETEKQFIWFEKSCHFPQWSEAEKFHQLLIQLLTTDKK